MKLACYVRVSTLEQVTHGDSLDGQKISAKTSAKEKGHQITHWYIDEGKSAYKNIKRREFERMISDISNGEIAVEGVLVFSLSRLSRTLLEQLKAMEVLKEKGVSVLSIMEPYISENKSSFILSSVIGMVNQQQSEQNSDKVVHRLADTARKTNSQAELFHMAMYLYLWKRKIIIAENDLKLTQKNKDKLLISSIWLTKV